ncbi:hypothetical protein [Chryseobacterium sp. MMS23-Vi53]|uniref:hypothetical protein n=1 Tax=Chryseobacterium sp. MMS23-Vi53 TaxID=3386644 RepID=UPI0039E91E6B
MIHPFISFIKNEVYEKTQYNISKKTFDKSKTICFSEKDLTKAEWKEEKEFILNDFSYDVISINVVNGTKYFYCYVDKKDLVINSILKLSGFFTSKKVYAWRHFELPMQGKKLIKTSNSFAIFDYREFNFNNSFYLKSKSDYSKRLENTFDLSIVIPPPEKVLDSILFNVI